MSVDIYVCVYVNIGGSSGIEGAVLFSLSLLSFFFFGEGKYRGSALKIVEEYMYIV